MASTLATVLTSSKHTSLHPPPPPPQIIPNSFLANSSTSAVFAGILLNFLLKHMDELGSKHTLLSTLLCIHSKHLCNNCTMFTAYMFYAYTHARTHAQAHARAHTHTHTCTRTHTRSYNSCCLVSSLANSDLSNLYLKMFKLVFGSVTLFAQENELMLKVRPAAVWSFAQQHYMLFSIYFSAQFVHGCHVGYCLLLLFFLASSSRDCQQFHANGSHCS